MSRHRVRAGCDAYGTDGDVCNATDIGSFWLPSNARGHIVARLCFEHSRTIDGAILVPGDPCPVDVGVGTLVREEDRDAT